MRETEATLRAEKKAQAEELADVTSARDELDDEVRRLKELGNAREIELSKLRSTLTDLRVQHSAALDDVNRYRADAERQGERARGSWRRRRPRR